MFRSYRLNPQTEHEDELAFDWDPESGDLRGSGAEAVRKLCERAVQIGHVNGHPYPTPFDITDPLHRPAEMAVVLGQFWVLDTDLQAAYPQLPPSDDAEEGIDPSVLH